MSLWSSIIETSDQMAAEAPKITVIKNHKTEELKLVVTEEILSEKEEEVLGYLPPSVITSKVLPGWKVSGAYPRALFKDRGHKLLEKHRVYREKPEIKKVVGKKGKKRQQKKLAAIQESHPLDDPRFTKWQQQLAEIIHFGNHVILDIATSCGKSWASTMIVTYETLSRNNATAIFVSPNSEIMRESVNEITTQNYKHYITAKSRMLDTQTRSYCTYNEQNEPQAQIMCLTADNFVSFVTNDLNKNFISKLKYIVFDEVHLDEVATTLWWSTLLPQNAQFILLSATLGDVNSTVTELKEHATDLPVRVIKYNIRPIPLQRLLFKGCDLPENGYKCLTLKGAKRLSCQVNPFDPTARDIRFLDRSVNTKSMDRESQFHAGQAVVASYDMDTLRSKINEDIEEAIVDPTAENIYKLLSYLFSNSMQPALIFNTSSAKAQQLAKALVAYISSVEHSDEEFCKANKAQRNLHKNEKRERDKAAEAEKKAAKTGSKWTAKPDDETKTTDIEAEITAALHKWKFPSRFGDIPRNIPEWVQQCLEYGIGVYLHSFPAWLRYKMFDKFKDGKLEVMIADATISVGINLPVRTCILCGDDMTPAIYKQMGGRAGRRGYDNQGYIIPMFLKSSIQHCLFTDSEPVSITMPTTMGYTELIRLMTPGEVANFYSPKNEFDRKQPLPPGTQFPLPGFSDAENPTLKDFILARYRERLQRSQLEDLNYQIDTIKRHMWHYHRLTNLIQSLPYNETMIFMQLLIDGDIKKLDVSELIKLVGLLFYPKELRDDSDQKLTISVPLLTKIQKCADYFKIPRDFTADVSNYFDRFCRTNYYHAEDIHEIEKIGEWLYILKRQLNIVAPRDDYIKQMVAKFDERFMAACKAVDLQ